MKMEIEPPLHGFIIMNTIHRYANSFLRVVLTYLPWLGFLLTIFKIAPREQCEPTGNRKNHMN